MPEQFALFADAPALPDGLRYAADFISLAAEHELVACVAALPLQPFQFGQYEGKRRVASFGWRYDYSQRRLLPAEPIPDWLTALLRQVEAFGGSDTHIDQILCTEYEAGVGIGWHRDKPHFGRIFGVSLGSSCRLRFRRSVGDGWDRRALDVAPRSIYALSGPSRLEWEHSIPAGAPFRFRDPARFSLAHGGKDRHPYPVPIEVYDETIRVLKSAVQQAKLDADERMTR